MKALGSMSMVILLLAETFLTACVVLIPAAIHYYSSEKHFTATAEIPISADKIYSNLIRRGEERPYVRILKQDDDKRFIEATDGVQWASFKVLQISESRSRLTITADVPHEDPKFEERREEELALRAFKTLCDELGVKYTVVED